MKTRSSKSKNKKGCGLIDSIINKLPEIHIPGYQFCGPGTELQKRLTRGDRGINKLDQACKAHDISYNLSKNSAERSKADKALIARASSRIYSQNAQLGERASALLVTGLMGAKVGLSKIGLGLVKSKASSHKKIKSQRQRRVRMKGVQKRKSKKQTKVKKVKGNAIAFNKLVGGVRESIKRGRPKSVTLKDAIKAAIRSGQYLKRNKTSNLQRILKLPKFGGKIGDIHRIVPILGALCAIGLIPKSAKGAEKVFKIIQNAAQSNSMSEGTEKKIGRGLVLLRSGAGFYLKPFKHH